MLDALTVKQLVRLDDTYNWVRHVTMPRARALHMQVVNQLGHGRSAHMGPLVSALNAGAAVFVPDLPDLTMVDVTDAHAVSMHETKLAELEAVVDELRKQTTASSGAPSALSSPSSRTSRSRSPCRPSPSPRAPTSPLPRSPSRVCSVAHELPTPVRQSLDAEFKAFRGEQHKHWAQKIEVLRGMVPEGDFPAQVRSLAEAVSETMTAAFAQRLPADAAAVYGHLLRPAFHAHVQSCLNHWSRQATPTGPAALDLSTAGRRLARPLSPHPPHVLSQAPGFGKGPARSRRKRRQDQ